MATRFPSSQVTTFLLLAATNTCCILRTFRQVSETKRLRPLAFAHMRAILFDCEYAEEKP